MGPRHGDFSQEAQHLHGCFFKRSIKVTFTKKLICRSWHSKVEQAAKSLFHPQLRVGLAADAQNWIPNAHCK
jgi:hypothetical protein